MIQTRNFNGEYVYGLVRNTSFLTAKGSLVREILYPSEFNFKFNNDSEKFIMIGFLIAIIGIIASIPIYVKNGFGFFFILDCCANMFTITVPPALPAALAVGTLFAIVRLKKSQIFCISPMRVNLAARIKTFVFDKTGTLTEDDISILGFRPVESRESDSKEKLNIVFTEFETEADALEPKSFWWLCSDFKNYRE